jgi:hypothetical protein
VIGEKRHLLKLTLLLKHCNAFCSWKHHVNLLLQRFFISTNNNVPIISTDEDPGIRIESFAVINQIYLTCYMTLHYYSAHSPLGLFSDRLHQVLRLIMLLTRVKTLRLLQVVNKLLQVGSEQDAAILCGPLAAMLSTILFTLVRTILLMADESTRLNNVVGTGQFNLISFMFCIVNNLENYCFNKRKQP